MNTPAPNKNSTAIARLSRDDRSRGIDRLKQKLDLFMETGNREFVKEAIAIVEILKEQEHA